MKHFAKCLRTCGAWRLLRVQTTQGGVATATLKLGSLDGQTGTCLVGAQRYVFLPLGRCGWQQWTQAVTRPRGHSFLRASTRCTLSTQRRGHLLWSSPLGSRFLSSVSSTVCNSDAVFASEWMAAPRSVRTVEAVMLRPCRWQMKLMKSSRSCVLSGVRSRVNL